MFDIEINYNPAARVTVVIPALDPDGKFITLIKELHAIGFDDIIVVDDGSAPAAAAYLDEAASLGCDVCHHDACRGKGNALKTGFARYLDSHPGRIGVISADADGQHRPDDILTCARMLCEGGGEVILGTRNLADKSIPARSRIGSRITALMLMLFCGLRSSDPQTGLRGIPHEYIAPLSRVRGDRYEYETAVLLECKTMHLPFREFNIDADYSAEDRVSHFRSVRDSLRVNGLFLKFMMSSASSYCIDVVAFYLFTRFIGAYLEPFSVPICTLDARVISATFCFIINRKTVFRAGDDPKRSTLCYFFSSALIMAFSAGGVWLLTHLLSADLAIVRTLLKMCVDTLLFFVNFRLQREWVFKPRRVRLPGKESIV